MDVQSVTSTYLHGCAISYLYLALFPFSVGIQNATPCRIEYWSDSIEVELHVCCPPQLYCTFNVNASTCHACVVYTDLSDLPLTFLHKTLWSHSQSLITCICVHVRRCMYRKMHMKQLLYQLVCSSLTHYNIIKHLYSLSS